MAMIKKVNMVFLSFLLGGVAGSAIALLYAPAKGMHLREDIRRKTNKFIKDGKRKANESWSDAKDKAESLIDSANEVINTNVEKIVRKTENFKESSKSEVAAYGDERKP